MAPTWDILARQYLAQRDQSLLAQAFDATADPDVRAMLHAFEQHDVRQTQHRTRTLFAVLMGSERREEAATVSLLALDSQVMLIESCKQAPLDQQGRLLQIGMDACAEAIQLSEALDDSPCIGYFRCVQAGGYYQIQEFSAARRAYQESLVVRRRLAQAQPAAFLPDVAMTLNNLGAVLCKLREFSAARRVYEEALAIRRRLEPMKPRAYLAETAGTLNNLGAVLRRNRKLEEAQRTFEEALRILRDLANEQPKAYLPDLAMTLNNLGVVLRDLRELEEARRVYEEAVVVRRRLAQAQPAFLPDVAMTLNNLSNVLRDLGELVQARTMFEEALGIYRDLANEQPKAYLSYVATTLNNLGVVLGDLRELEEARRVYEEAVVVHRRLAQAQPAFLPDVAKTLNNLGVVLSDLGELVQARTTIEEALGIYRDLANEQPKAYLPDLAMTLNNLGNVLSDLHELAAAGPHYEEAVALYESHELWLDASLTHFNLGSVEEQKPNAQQYIRDHFRACVRRCEQGLRQLQETQYRDKFKGKVEYAYTWLIEDAARRTQSGQNPAESELVRLLEAVRQIESLAELGVLADGETAQAHDQIQGRTAALLSEHNAVLLWVQATPKAVVFGLQTPETGLRVALADRALLERMQALDVAIRRAIEIRAEIGRERSDDGTDMNAETEQESPEVDNHAQEVYNALPDMVKTLLTDRSEQAVFVVPCSVTVNLPWELIQIPAAQGWEYLGLHRHLPRLHSARHLPEMLQRQPRRSNKPPVRSHSNLRRVEIRPRQFQHSNVPPTAILVGDPTQDLEHSYFAAEELQALLTRKCGFRLAPHGRALTREQATKTVLEAALNEEFVLWVQLSHGGADESHLYLAMADGGKVYPKAIAQRKWHQNPVVHYACCFTGWTIAEGGGRFSGHPTAALVAGASCVLSSTMPLFDADDAEFCLRLYRRALDPQKPQTFGDALLATRREMAAEYGGNPMMWGQYALWGNPWARLVA